MMWYEKPLVMSVADIVKEFREAKYPERQVEILAQLNDTRTVRIAWLLNRAGETVDARKLPREPRTEDGVDLNEVWASLPEAAEADVIRANRSEPSAEPVKKEPVKKEPVYDTDEITSELWCAYLKYVDIRALGKDDVRDMMLLRDIAGRIGGDEDAEVG